MMFNSNNDSGVVYQSCGIADAQLLSINDSETSTLTLTSNSNVAQSAYDIYSLCKMDITEMLPYYDSDFAVKANTIDFPHDSNTTIAFVSNFLQSNNIYYTCNRGSGLFICEIPHNHTLLRMNIQLFECDGNDNTMLELFRLCGDAGLFCHIVKGLRNIITSDSSSVILSSYSDVSFDTISSILNMSKTKDADADAANDDDNHDTIMTTHDTVDYCNKWLVCDPSEAIPEVTQILINMPYGCAQQIQLIHSIADCLLHISALYPLPHSSTAIDGGHCHMFTTEYDLIHSHTVLFMDTLIRYINKYDNGMLHINNNHIHNNNNITTNNYCNEEQQPLAVTRSEMNNVLNNVGDKLKTIVIGRMNESTRSITRGQEMGELYIHRITRDVKTHFTWI
jgi:hypothetical protein